MGHETWDMGHGTGDRGQGTGDRTAHIDEGIDDVARRLGLALEPGPGAWNLEPGTWSLEPGAWNLKPGTWSLEPGAWSAESGAWSLEPRARDTLRAFPPCLRLPGRPGVSCSRASREARRD